MEQSKQPLTYPCLINVLQYTSFSKRKELFLYCPSIRKHEERLGYRLERVSVNQDEPHRECEIHFDSFKVAFEKMEDVLECQIRMGQQRRKALSIRTIKLNKQEAAEKWILYMLSRPGTHVKSFELLNTPICILKCNPILIERMSVSVLDSAPDYYNAWIQTNNPIEKLTTVKIIRDEMIKNALRVIVKKDYDEHPNDGEVLSEWNCETLTIEQEFSLDKVIDYIKKISEKGKPIGFIYNSCWRYGNLEFATLDWLAGKTNARKTRWNGRKCATLEINELSELNIHGNLDEFSDALVIEVNSKGTAINR